MILHNKTRFLVRQKSRMVDYLMANGHKHVDNFKMPIIGAANLGVGEFDFKNMDHMTYLRKKH